MAKTYTAYVLTEQSRQRLLAVYQPRFPVVRAHHVTVQFGVLDNTPPPAPATVEVVGYAKDDGLEALVVAVNGTLMRRDCGVYHITWSHTAVRKPVESNALVDKGWTMSGPYAVETTPEVCK